MSNRPSFSDQPEPAAPSPYEAFSVYGALDDVALAALGNRGLLRRGRAELAAGRVEPEEDSADGDTASHPAPKTLIVRVGRPAVLVTLTAAGPQDARCPCPVAGVCLHILAACLWMREAVNREGAAEDASLAGQTSGASASEAQPAVPRISQAPDHEVGGESVLEEVLAWDPADVGRTLGAEARRRVQASLAGLDPDRLAAGTEVSSAPGRLSITWPDAPEVIVIAGLGPRGMIVSGRHSPATTAAWCLQAIVRIFARAGRPWPWPDQDTSLNARRRETLSTSSAVIERIVSAGISHAGPRSAEDIDRLSQAARLEELPRLSRLLTSAAGRLRALAEHDDAVDEATVLSALAAAWSLTRALAAATGSPAPALIGRADTQTADLGLLLPLSATWWTAPSGSRGLTIRLWDLDNHRPETVTTGRAAGVDDAFHYSEDAILMWGTSMKNILSGPLRLTGAARRPDGSLAPSSRTTVTRSNGEISYDNIDLEAVAGQLQQIGPGSDPGQAASFEAPAPRVGLIMVAPDGLGPIDIDEVHQHYLWPVTSTDGCTHLLRMDTGGWEMQLVSDVRSRELQVHAITVEGDRPAGIFVREERRIRLLAATFPPSRNTFNRAYHRLPRPEGQADSRAPARDGTDRTLMEALAQDVHEALTALAASGTMRPTGMVAHVLRTRARAAGDLQLTTLGKALLKVIDQPSPGAVLRACAVVDRVQALARWYR